ncbi:hypothetical protein Ancab_004205 [Ancistrocladus abbreviatus]
MGLLKEIELLTLVVDRVLVEAISSNLKGHHTLMANGNFTETIKYVEIAKEHLRFELLMTADGGRAIVVDGSGATVVDDNGVAAADSGICRQGSTNTAQTSC